MNHPYIRAYLAVLLVLALWGDVTGQPLALWAWMMAVPLIAVAGLLAWAALWAMLGSLRGPRSTR